MKLTLLGTGTSQGVPVVACDCPVCSSLDPKDRHLRSSALVTMDNGDNILIDIGPDFREQMLREKVSHLDAILITHAHRDHVGGIDDIRSFNYVQNRRMDIYANQQTLSSLQRDYHYIFEPHPFPGLPEADLHLVDGTCDFFASSHRITPIKCMHKDLPILGYRIGKLAYITDANFIASEEQQKLLGLDLLVINALRKEKHFSHFSLPEALLLIDSLKPKAAYITHVSHQMGLYQDVSKELPPNVHLAYDRLSISLP